MRRLSVSGVWYKLGALALVAGLLLFFWLRPPSTPALQSVRFSNADAVSKALVSADSAGDTVRFDSIAQANTCLLNDVLAKTLHRCILSTGNGDSVTATMNRVVIRVLYDRGGLSPYWRDLSSRVVNDWDAADLRHCAELQDRFRAAFRITDSSWKDSADLVCIALGEFGLRHRIVEVEFAFGRRYWEEEQLLPAAEHLQAAAALAEETGQIETTIKMLTFLSDVLTQQGEIASGLQVWERARDLADSCGLEEQAQAAVLRLARDYFYLGDYRAALRCYDDLAQRCAAYGAKDEYYSSFAHKALCYQRLRDQTTADSLFGVVLDAALGNTRNWARVYWADGLIDRRDTVGLRPDLIGAATSDTTEHDLVAAARYQLARLNLLARDWTQAIVDGESAAAGFDDDKDVLYASQVIGRAFLRAGNLDSALAWLTSASDLLTGARTAFPRSELRKRYFVDKYNLVSDLIQAHLARGDIDTAFNVAEEYKSAALRDALRERDLGVLQTGAYDEPVERLQDQLSRQLRQVRDCHSASSDLGAIEEKIACFQDSLSDLNLRVASEAPVQAESHIATSGQFESMSRADEIALYYFCHDDFIAVWYRTESGLQSEVLSERVRGLSDSIWTALKLVRSKPQTIDARACTDSALSHLSSLIPEAVRSRIAEGRRLVVYPSGLLYYLPLEALRINGRYLGDMVAIEYRHSLSIGRTAGPASTVLHPASRIAVFGGTFASVDTLPCPDEPGHQLSKYRNLVALKAIEQEADTISDMFASNTTVFLDESGQEERFKALPAGFYDVLHIATHGIIIESSPDLSGLVLPLSQSDEEDQILRPDEIRQLNLGAKLVVLSACRSGDGELIPGEGVQGLTQSFMLADCEAVVASLWSIGDQSTSLFMRKFYGALLDGDDVPASLLQARRSLIHGSPFGHPFYWAAFVSILR